MAKCIFDNLTEEQAEILANWFEGQGEQDSSIWFENRDVQNPLTNSIKKLENGDVVVECR